MNVIYRGILQLIKSALTGQKQELPEGFVLEDAQEIIRIQSMAPLIYPGAITCGICAQSELMRKYQVQYFQHMVAADKQLREVERICAVFEANDIDYMLLKGCNLKKLYPKPEMRSMSDADILIRLEQYDRISPLMQSLQFEYKEESFHDFVWKNSALYLELHKRLFAKNEGDLYRYFGEGWRKSVRLGDNRYGLSIEDEFIYIFAHMAKHFRFSGIGAKHLVDLYVYRQAYPQMDNVQIEKAMLKLNMLDFYRNIVRTLDNWFEGGPGDSVTETITEYIFTSGSFGTLQNRLYNEELVKSKKKNKIKGSRWRTIMRTLFPPLDMMQLAYNVLYKWKILLPLFWPIRWVHVLLCKRGNISHKMTIIRGITDEKVVARERLMEHMGVTFYCEDDD